MIEPSKAAYLAGFFDGEGSVYAATRWHRHNEKDRRPTPTIFVCMTNTHFYVMRVHQEMFGGTLTERNNLKPNLQAQIQWHLCAKKAEPYLRAIAPYLIVKRDVVNVAIEYIDLLKTPRREQRDYTLTVERAGRRWVTPTVRPEFRSKVLDLHGQIRMLNAKAAPFNYRRGFNPWESAVA